MSDVLLAELKTWQGGLGALIGASFGFVALVVGALFNYRLNRRRDAELRAEEALSVAAALYGEILLLRKDAATLARAVANVHISRGTRRHSTARIDSHFIEAYTPSEPILYKALASKIGLLSSDLVIAITEFHANYQESRAALPLLVDNSERGYSFSVLTVLRPARDAVQGIVPALRRIEVLAAIQRPAEDPALGEAGTVIEMEEDLHNMPSPPN